MVHPEDLDIFGRITGHRTLTPEFEEEYGLWLKMHHRNKGQGGIGSLMIPLMRSLDIGPKAEPKFTEERINWAAVQPMTRILAHTDTGPKMGRYVGLREYGILAVLYDGDPMVRNIEPTKVKLVTDEEPGTAVPVVEEKEQEDEAPRIIEEAPPTPLTEIDELPEFNTAHDPDPTGEVEPPKLDSAEWYRRAIGSPVLVQLKDDTAEGALVKIGPGDNELTVWLDGADEPEVFSETDVLAAV